MEKDPSPRKRRKAKSGDNAVTSVKVNHNGRKQYTGECIRVVSFSCRLGSNVRIMLLRGCHNLEALLQTRFHVNKQS